MFWHSDCYHHCRHHHHAWYSFRRGMVAMLILAFAVMGLLDYHPHRGHTRAHHSVSHAATSHRHHRPGQAGQRRGRPLPKPSSTHHRVRQIRPADRRHEPAGGLSTATAAGQDLSWNDFHGIQLPVSSTAGPRHTRGGLASGFTDTPQGALLAAVNIAVRTAAQWGPAVFQPTISGQVTGRYALALLRADILSYAQAGASSGKPVQPTVFELAYRFLAYSHAAATISLVTSGPGANGTSVLAATRLRVVWLRGDWRLAAPPGGDWARLAAPISSLAGYAIFPSER
ncbi:MAG TPA: hypothetical protein VNF47_27570 [Streptosporangiaceae bacterium]|nr:hypothetical protein [Streptosporangiaceae bacterium]